MLVETVAFLETATTAATRAGFAAALQSRRVWLQKCRYRSLCVSIIYVGNGKVGGRGEQDIVPVARFIGPDGPRAPDDIGACDRAEITPVKAAGGATRCRVRICRPYRSELGRIEEGRHPRRTRRYRAARQAFGCNAEGSEQ